MDHGCYKRMRHGSISRAASPPAREDEGGGWDEAVEDDCLEQEQEQAQARQEDAAAAATGLAGPSTLSALSRGCKLALFLLWVGRAPAVIGSPAPHMHLVQQPWKLEL
jgi:hypothetical protein